MAALNELTAVEIVDALAKREASAREVVTACLAQIDATDGELNAWVERNGDSALWQADLADARLKANASHGPLEGVPVAVKDIIDVAGFRTQAGFAPFAENVAGMDADVVANMRAAGAIFIGKVSTAQFAVSDPPPTISPWSPALTPGGSSTGSGVTVAARQVPMALGTQTGGSILRPAAYNGVVGFKPTFGVVPIRGVYPLAPSLDHVGIITRSISDCALFLSVAASRPASSTRTPPPSAEDLLPPRVGVLDAAVGTADEVTQGAARRAIDALEDAGAEIRHLDLDPPLETFNSTYRVIMQTEAAATHGDLFTSHREYYGSQLRAYLDVGREIPAWIFYRAQRLRHQLADRFSGWMQRYGVDVVALPATPTVPPSRESTGSSAFLSPFSLLGSPTIALPCGVAGGLPQSLQLAGLPGDDDRLLKTARWCEEVLGPSPVPPILSSQVRDSSSGA